MHFGQIDVLHIIRAVVVADLSSCPIDAFDPDNLAILDLPTEGNYSILSVSIGSIMSYRTYYRGAIDSIAEISSMSRKSNADWLTCKYGCSAAGFFRSTFNAVRIGPGIVKARMREKSRGEDAENSYS
jgi:hypothetical protein